MTMLDPHKGISLFEFNIIFVSAWVIPLIISVVMTIWDSL